jgi:glycosyltransferase involved in cell wall biosynthesis
VTALSIVVPCFNEEAVLPASAARLLACLDDLAASGRAAAESRLYFVDDGSTDGTWGLIEELAAGDARVCGIKLSRNRGHQNALLAGLLHAEGDVLISIDADLQDDVDAMAKMMDAHRDGSDIVYGVRASRSSDTWFKRVTAGAYYRLLRVLGTRVVAHHADYRLMSRRVVEALRAHEEVNLFLRGLVPTLGFPSTVVTYDRKPREAGESKYPLRRMVVLALDGITSFSPVPLRMIAVLGFLIFVISIGVSCWVLWARFFTDRTIPGWASSVLPMYLLGGIQLLSIGVLGEYIGKIYMETKGRPRYFVDKTVGGSRRDEP